MTKDNCWGLLGAPFVIYDLVGFDDNGVFRVGNSKIEAFFSAPREIETPYRQSKENRKKSKNNVSIDHCIN